MKKLVAIEEKMYPNWYWPYGLHDAEVKQINELVLSIDWKAKWPKIIVWKYY